MLFNKRKRIIINIEGMHCDACAKRIDNALEELGDIDSVKVDLKKKLVTVFYDNNIDITLLQKTIEELGYTVTGIKEKH